MTNNTNTNTNTNNTKIEKNNKRTITIDHVTIKLSDVYAAVFEAFDEMTADEQLALVEAIDEATYDEASKHIDVCNAILADEAADEATRHAVEAYRDALLVDVADILSAAVCKKIDVAAATEATRRIRCQRNIDVAMLSNTAAVVSREVSNETNAEGNTAEVYDEQYHEALHGRRGVLRPLADGADIFQSVAETLFRYGREGLAATHVERRLDKRVVIRDEAAPKWKAEEVTAAQAAFRSGRAVIDNNRHVAAMPCQKYSYIAEYAAVGKDGAKEGEIETAERLFYRRTPKYFNVFETEYRHGFDEAGHDAPLSAEAAKAEAEAEATAAARVVEALKLSDAQRAIVALKMTDETYGAKALAARLDVRPDTVKKDIKRIKAKAEKSGLTKPLHDKRQAEAFRAFLRHEAETAAEIDEAIERAEARRRMTAWKAAEAEKAARREAEAAAAKAATISAARRRLIAKAEARKAEARRRLIEKAEARKAAAEISAEEKAARKAAAAEREKARKAYDKKLAEASKAAEMARKLKYKKAAAEAEKAARKLTAAEEAEAAAKAESIAANKTYIAKAEAEAKARKKGTKAAAEKAAEKAAAAKAEAAEKAAAYFDAKRKREKAEALANASKERADVFAKDVMA